MINFNLYSQKISGNYSNYSKCLNIHFLQAEYHEKNKAITREDTKQIW